MNKHPADRLERLKLNEKKTTPKPRVPKVKRKLREAIVIQETEDELKRADSGYDDFNPNRERLNRDLVENDLLHL